MKLSVKFLKNVANVNCFQYVSHWDISEGSENTLYFKTIDKLKEDIRYIPQGTVNAMEVTFLDIDSDAEIVKTATNPYSDDLSLWCVTLTAAQVVNSGAVKFKLTQDGVETLFVVQQAITVDLLESGSC